MSCAVGLSCAVVCRSDALRGGGGVAFESWPDERKEEEKRKTRQRRRGGLGAHSGVVMLLLMGCLLGRQFDTNFQLEVGEVVVKWVFLIDGPQSGTGSLQAT